MIHLLPTMAWEFDLELQNFANASQRPCQRFPRGSAGLPGISQARLDEALTKGSAYHQPSLETG